MRKIKCIKIIHVKFRGVQKLIIFRYLFPWDTFFCFYTETNFLTKCHSHYPYILWVHRQFSISRSSPPEVFSKYAPSLQVNTHLPSYYSPPCDTYAKQKLFLRNYSISVIFAFQEDQKCIFKTSKKAKMQFFPSAPTVVVLAAII